ncbi:MAG: hypothetical protein LBG80_09195 [Bacteroidales bacterium]|jgi:hypothetical protein|nr:hypothetical protein [Bacteroidales bacterium]
MTALSEDFLSATTEINAGTACRDRANEVEPRPNEGKNDSMKGKSRDEATCSDEVLPRSNYPRRFYLRNKKNNIRNVLRINAGIACSECFHTTSKGQKRSNNAVIAGVTPHPKRSGEQRS